MFPSTLLGTGENWTMMKTISVTEYLNYESGMTNFSHMVLLLLAFLTVSHSFIVDYYTALYGFGITLLFNYLLRLGKIILLIIRKFLPPNKPETS